MPRPATILPEVTLQDGARLFVAADRLLTLAAAAPRRYMFYTLAWLSGGGAAFVCDGERFEVAPGSLICMAPAQVHWWEAPDPQVQLTLLGFLPEIFTGGVLDVRLITDLPLFKPDGTTVAAAHGEGRAALEHLFGQAWTRYEQSANPGPTQTWRILPRQRESLMLAYLHAILAEAALLEVGAAAVPLTLAQSADLRLTRLFRIHVVAGPLSRRPVTHYAELLHVTPDHLARVVRRVTGKTPSAWLHDRLLIEAVRLLTFTNQPTEQIAEALQFPTATQFSQWFRSRSGQTPRQVRQGQTYSTDASLHIGYSTVLNGH